jgi:hypothetical protein
MTSILLCHFTDGDCSGIIIIELRAVPDLDEDVTMVRSSDATCPSCTESEPHVRRTAIRPRPPVGGVPRKIR